MNRRSRKMMQCEFEKLAGREVTDRQYRAFETLYNAGDMDKFEFVESVRGILEHIPEPAKKRKKVVVALLDPNGHMIIIDGKVITAEAELISANLAKGTAIYRMVPDSVRLRNAGNVDLCEDANKFRWEGEVEKA